MVDGLQGIVGKCVVVTGGATGICGVRIANARLMPRLGGYAGLPLRSDARIEALVVDDGPRLVRVFGYRRHQFSPLESRSCGLPSPEAGTFSLACCV